MASGLMEDVEEDKYRECKFHNPDYISGNRPWVGSHTILEVKTIFTIQNKLVIKTNLKFAFVKAKTLITAGHDSVRYLQSYRLTSLRTS
jgi:hypothetical protein